MKSVAKLILICLTVSFAACSTVAGAGKDITDSANTVRGWMGGK